MEELVITITLKFDDEDVMNECAGPIDSAVAECIASLAENNPAIVDYNIVTE